MDENARLLWQDRLLARRTDLTRAELETGRDALIRRDEILVPARYAADVESHASQWIDHVKYDEDAMLARVRLRPGLGLRPELLARDLNAESVALQANWAVSPNHVMAGMPGSWGGGPAAPPGFLETPPTLASATAQRAVTPMTVAVLDTGISAHPWFADQPWFAEVRDQDLELLDELPQDDVLDAQAGHGTFIIGVVMQHAPAAWIVAPKLLTSDGICEEFDVVRKLRRLKRWSDTTGRHLDVVNLSFGGPTVNDLPPTHVAEAITALGPDTVVVACAGNDSTNRPFWPAALDSVIAVGALDSDGSHPAPFSNFGPWVNASSIGERVASSFVTFDGPTPSTGDFDDDRFNGFAHWSGTSFAAPRVAGAIAALAMTQGITATEAASIVLDPATTQSIPDFGVVVAGA